ncbi:MAG: HAMP domain-containing histidine kinase, partial [Candidatus Gastranaerophilales bacterium]|nr:HAMP domain-containing histidine kinase [Candidatus Gastranaerophilales bacterium]
LIPFVTIGLIISNISQQSVRNELQNTTYLMANFIGDSYEKYIDLSQLQLNRIASSFNYIPNAMDKLRYFNEIEQQTKVFKNIRILEKNRLPAEYNYSNGKITLVSNIDAKYSLAAEINVDIINSLLNKDVLKGRDVYIFDNKTKTLLSTNVKENPNLSIINDIDENNNEETGFFGKKKNVPKVYYKLENPNWTVIVDTTKKVSANTITKARKRIILALSLAALFIILVVSLYTYYLYINIRQLFKGITAVSKGNYDKKIHLIKSIFTPHETVFIAKEFNYMANKIKVSYKDLKEKNKELQKLNEFRENLVNATSHEFRTPLTSIIGYSSRLLRKDIVLDEETKTKSIQVIKQQAQRLSNMVEDLLVIPELESYSLKFNIQETDLADIINRAIEYLSTKEASFDTNIDENLNFVWADEYRLEQILINLIDNAIKYNKDDSPIKIEAKNESGYPIVKITNKCDPISDEIKEKLFEKFIRADSKLTRTTRGTGLGLYIVKGLAENMKIDIELVCEDEFTIILKFNDYVK